MAAGYKHPRGTRAALNAKATAGTIVPGQLYLITDEGRIAMGLTTTTFEVYAKVGDVTVADGSITLAKLAILAKTESIIVALGDETTATKTGTSVVTMRLPYAMYLTSVRGGLSTAQTSGNALTVDVKAGGTSVFNGAKLTFNNASRTTVGATAPGALPAAALASDTELTFDITQIGDGTAKGLKVTLIGYKA